MITVRGFTIADGVAALNDDEIERHCWESITSLHLLRNSEPDTMHKVTELWRKHQYWLLQYGYLCLERLRAINEHRADDQTFINYAALIESHLDSFNTQICDTEMFDPDVEDWQTSHRASPPRTKEPS